MLHVLFSLLLLLLAAKLASFLHSKSSWQSWIFYQFYHHLGTPNVGSGKGVCAVRSGKIIIYANLEILGMLYVIQDGSVILHACILINSSITTIYTTLLAWRPHGSILLGTLQSHILPDEPFNPKCCKGANWMSSLNIVVTNPLMLTKHLVEQVAHGTKTVKHCPLTGSSLVNIKCWFDHIRLGLCHCRLS